LPIAAALAAVLISPSAEAHSRHANERTGRLAPAFAELVKARKRGDRGALGRLGDRIGPARLAQAITGSDGRVADAALAAAPLVRGGVLLIGPIAEVLGGDAARATAAATALGALLDGSVPSALEDWDVPPDVVGRACSGLRGLAVRPGAATGTRLAALDAALAAVPSCGAGELDLAALAHDAAPEIRRAAVILVAGRPGPGTGQATLLREAMGDPDHTVSAAAVAADCRIEGRVGPGGKEAPPTAPAVNAARTMAVAATTPPADAVEMLDCLAAAATPADRALLDELRRGAASPLRDRAVELGELASRGRGSP